MAERETSDARRYLEAVQGLYLELRGGGLTLSPLDSDRIRSWRDRGLPLELALRALHDAHSSWAAADRSVRARPFTLKFAERQAEELLRVSARRLVQATPSPAVHRAPEAGEPVAPTPSRLGRIREALERAEESAAGPAREAISAALAALGRITEASDPPSIEGALHDADETSALRYLIALPRGEQAGVVSKAMARAGKRGAATKRRYRAMLRICLGDAARQHGDLTRPSDL